MPAQTALQNSTNHSTTQKGRTTTQGERSFTKNKNGLTKKHEKRKTYNVSTLCLLLSSEDIAQEYLPTRHG